MFWWGFGSFTNKKTQFREHKRCKNHSFGGQNSKTTAWQPNCSCRGTAWPGRFNGPIFGTHFLQPRKQTLHLNLLFRFWPELGLNPQSVLAWLVHCAYDCGYSMAWLVHCFPAISLQNPLESIVLKRQRNNRAWPVFISHLDLALTCTSTSDRQGLPKRRLQNSETAWPGELKKPVFWPVLGWSSMSNVAAGTDGLANSKARFLTCAGGSSMSNVAIKFSHAGPSQGALPLAGRGRRI